MVRRACILSALGALATLAVESVIVFEALCRLVSDFATVLIAPRRYG